MNKQDKRKFISYIKENRRLRNARIDFADSHTLHVYLNDRDQYIDITGFDAFPLRQVASAITDLIIDQDNSFKFCQKEMEELTYEQLVKKAVITEYDSYNSNVVVYERRGIRYAFTIVGKAVFSNGTVQNLELLVTKNVLQNLNVTPEDFFTDVFMATLQENGLSR